jgi:hypothetical protein
MFNINVEKFLIDQHVDTIRQERELLKQIAVLSSAILGISVLNLDKIESFGPLIKLGLIGLFITIIFSIFLLALILRLEKLEIYQVKNLTEKGYKIVGDWAKEFLKKSFKDSFDGILNKIFQNKNNESKLKEESKEPSVLSLIKEGLCDVKNLYDKFKEEDKKFQKKKKEMKFVSALYAYLSYLAILIFCVSLILIMIDVITKIF